MRIYKLKDEKLNTILKKRGEIVEENKEIFDKIETLQKVQQVMGYKMDRLKEKTFPLVDKYKNELKLDEFEVISRVFLEKDEILVEIVDQIEEYKKLIKEKK